MTEMDPNFFVKTLEYDSQHMIPESDSSKVVSPSLYSDKQSYPSINAENKDFVELQVYALELMPPVIPESTFSLLIHDFLFIKRRVENFVIEHKGKSLLTRFQNKGGFFSICSRSEKKFKQFGAVVALYHLLYQILIEKRPFQWIVFINQIYHCYPGLFYENIQRENAMYSRIHRQFRNLVHFRFIVFCETVDIDLSNIVF